MDDELNDEFTEEELIQRKVIQLEDQWEVLKDKLREGKDNECNND